MIFDLFKNLTGSIGRTGNNDVTDVAGIESALGSQDYLDLGKTDGPTGYFGARTEDAIKSFQKDNGLKADGVINPGGETVGQLAQKAASGPTPPTPPKVPGPRKPKPPTVPGAPSRKTDDEMNKKPRQPSEMDDLRKMIDDARRRMEKKSLGR